MTYTKQVKDLFGPDVEKYFINKQIGGNSNQKGSRYEDFFSVMQLAQLFQLLTNDDDKDDIEIYAQAEAFVDDLLIRFQKHNIQLDSPYLDLSKIIQKFNCSVHYSCNRECDILQSDNVKEFCNLIPYEHDNHLLARHLKDTGRLLPILKEILH